MATSLPASSADILDTLQPGQLAAAINAKNPQNDMEDVYLFDPDFVIKHWSEFRLGHLKDVNEYCLSVVGTRRIMRITEEGAKALIKRMNLVYKPNENHEGGGEWVNNDTQRVGANQSGGLVKGFIAKARSILAHAAPKS